MKTLCQCIQIQLQGFRLVPQAAAARRYLIIATTASELG